MEICEIDDFTQQEEMLLQELKVNCKDDGREVDPQISVPIFHQLGRLYLERSKISSTIERMTCLIRCAVLLNAALVRARDNTNVIKQDLKQLHQHLLKSAEVKRKDVDLCKKAEKVKILVEKMRMHVNKELCKVTKVKAHDSETKMCEQELNKVEAIKSLQNKITGDYTEIMANLAEDCRQIMGEAPCTFAIVGMGSLSRKEITPFSDFEHVIVLDSKFDGKNEEILNYFRWYSVIFQIILVDLGETIIPRVFNETNSKFGTWFYDDVTKSGVSFDGTFPWACKYPLGRQQLTKDKGWKTELIKSVPDMLKYLNSDEILKNGYHLGDILTKICYVYGDQSLYQEFNTGLNDILTKQNEDLKHEVLKQIQHDLENFAVRSVLLKITDESKYNVKKDVYRVTTLFVSALGRLNNITACSCFDIIRQLAETNEMSDYAKHHLMYAIALACEIRLRWYMINDRQRDYINGTVDATSKFLEIIGETSAVSYFQIAYALQCDISKRFDLKKGHFYSHPDLLNISIYSSFKSTKNVDNCISTFEVNPKEQRLLDFDSCMKMLKINPQHKQSETPTGSEREKRLCGKFYLIGLELLEMNKLIDAREYFEKALKIKQRLSSNIAVDRSVADTLHEIGRCLFYMNKLTDAIEYLEKALKIKQKISNNVEAERGMAHTMQEIGRCLMNMNKLSDAKEYLEKALKIKQQISSSADTDREVAVSLHEVGRCLIRMNKLVDARNSLEKALKIKQRISSDVDTDREVAVSLHEIGRCLVEMDKLSDAKIYLEKALQIKQRISSEVATDRDVAVTLHRIGRCLIGMNKLTDAKEYLEKSLKIKQLISSDVATDRDVAYTLLEIGRCLIEMNELTEAKDYLDKTLQIDQQISSEVATDRDRANTLHELGRCLIKLNKPTDAKVYLEKALQIKQRISSDVAADRDVAVSLHEIGRCLIEMNELTEAKVVLEKAQQIYQRISSDIATERDVRNISQEIDRCLIKMKESTDVKEYLEKH